MQSIIQNQHVIHNTDVSKGRLWTGRIMSGFIVLFMLFDSIIHFIKIEPVVQSFAQLGFPIGLSSTIAIIQFICIVLYVIPRTSVLGAVLFTGYLGGAVVTLMRAGEPLFSHVLFPVYFGIILWGGLFLRNNELRRIFPFRKTEEND
jgi:hypothetical protein